jgi:hypothetical protein
MSVEGFGSPYIDLTDESMTGQNRGAQCYPIAGDHLVRRRCHEKQFNSLFINNVNNNRFYSDYFPYFEKIKGDL